MKKSWNKWLLLGVIIIAIFFRFFKLNTLPEEIFGDMSQNLIHVENLLKGEWRLIYGYDGREGMWFYLVALTTVIFGNTYLALKFTAAVVGTLSVIMLFILGKELTNWFVALTAAALMATAKWNVVFSRIGFRVVLIPLFVSGVLFTYIRAKKSKDWRWYMATGVLLGLGMYTYPAFKLMVAGMIFILLIDLLRNRKRLSGSLVVFSALVVLCIPLFIDMKKNPEQYTSHTKQMLLNEDGKIRHDWPRAIGKNIVSQALMFNYQGDIVFRVNPIKQPLLDPISGVFLWIGILAWLINKKGEGLVLLMVFIFMQLPSILVLNNPQDIPSATRSLGITPVVHLMTAYGMWWLVQKIPLKINWRYGMMVMLLGIIGFINWHNYFNVYAYGLPNHNEAYDSIVAEYIKRAPKGVDIIMYDCCWADIGTPEPEGVSWRIKNDREMRYVKKDEALSLNNNVRTLVIYSPKIDIEGYGFYNETVEDRYGKTVFKALKNYVER